jgi:soluble lytic murein transglycosylase-like protein
MFETIILAAAKAANVSGSLLLAICMQETGLKNLVHLNDGTSHSYGVCQIKFSTAQAFGYKGPEQGLMDPKINAKYSAKYLKYQLDRYNGDWSRAAAAYNAGAYFESKKVKDCPKNLKYVREVASKLPYNLQHHLYCGNERKITKICLYYEFSGSKCVNLKDFNTLGKSEMP